MLSKTWTVPCCDLLAVAVVVALLGCGDGVDPDPNSAPSVTSAIPDQLLTEGDTVKIDLTSHFTDPDGDALTYTAASSNASVTSVSILGNRLTLIGVAPGEATVTVTATDTGGLTATQEFNTTVERRNRAPMVADSIPEQVLTRLDTVTVDLASHFEDPDGDSITYTAASSNEDLLAVAVSGDQLTLVGLRHGTAAVTVTAADPDSLTASQDFNTTVEGVNHAPEVVAEIGGVILEQDEYVIFNLSSYFSDPDDDLLTYTAVASDTSVVSVSINGDTLKLSSGVPDSITVDVTATDPRGLSATQDSDVDVDEGFSEEFGDLDTLRHWRLDSGTKAALSDDGLQLTLESVFCGGTYKEIRSYFSEWWSIDAVIGRQDSLAATYVTVGIDHARYKGYRLLIGSGMSSGGESVNYRFDVLDTNSSVPVWIPVEAGFSDGLDDSGYELNDVTLDYSASSDTLRARADTTELFTLELDEEGWPTVVTGTAGFGICSLASGGARAIVESGDLEGGHVNAMLGDLKAGPAIGSLSVGVRLRVLPSIRQDRVVERSRASIVAAPARRRPDR